MALGSNTIEFTIRGSDRFTGTFSKVNKALGTTIRTTAKFVGGATAAAGAVAFFTDRMARGEDAAAKFATRLGVAVDELTRMQHAAQVAGIQTTSFNMAVQRMTRRVGEAAKGTGEAQDVIAELGLDAERFARLPLSRQLGVIADRMDTLDGRADRLRVAFKLFDSEGVAMLQMLQQGSGAMQEMARDAEFLGIMVSKQAAANAEVFTSQTTRLTGAIKGASRALADEWIPVLSGLAEKTADALAGMRDELSDWAEKAMRAVIGIFVVLRNVTSTLSRDFDRLFSGDVWTNFAQVVKTVLNGLLIAFGGFIEHASNVLVGGFRVAWAAVPDLGKWALAQIGNLFVNGIPALVRFVVQVFSRGFENIVNIAKDAWRNIKNALTGGDTESLSQIILRNFDASIRKLASDIPHIFGAVIDNAPDLSILLDDLNSSTEAARQHMTRVFQRLSDDVQMIAAQMGSSFTQHFGLSAEQITAEIDKIIAKLEKMGAVAEEESQEGAARVKTFMEELNSLVTKQLATIGTVQKQLAQGFLDTMMSAVDQISAGLAQVIVAGRSFGDMMKQVGKAVLAQLVQMLIKIGLQRVVLLGIQKAAETSIAAAQMARATALTYANAFASTAAIPIVGPAMAPAVAAASTAAMQAGATAAGASGAALGTSLTGVSHGGMENVPREGTWLLDRGERVVSRRQNEDLTRFLQDGGGGGTTIHIGQVVQRIDASTFRQLMGMSDRQAQEFMARKLIPATDRLSRQGVRPVDIERTGR